MISQITYISFGVAFGCLFWAPNGNVLLGLSIATAAVGGCVDALYTVVLYADISDHFKEKSGTMISFLTCLWQAGFMTGTSLGGVLIDLWDFPLPFFVFGALLSLSLPFIGKREMERDQTAIVGTCESRCLESGVSTDPEPCGFARPRMAVRGFPVSGEKGILVVEPSPG
ncbi:hypothetical protein ISCGN_011242 [Ixodes scapularis]